MKNKEHNIGTVVYLNPESKWAQRKDVTNPKDTAGVIVKDDGCSDRWIYVFWSPLGCARGRWPWSTF